MANIDKFGRSQNSSQQRYYLKRPLIESIIGIEVANDGNITAHNKRIKHVHQPIEGADVVNKQYMDGKIKSSISNAETNIKRYINSTMQSALQVKVNEILLKINDGIENVNKAIFEFENNYKPNFTELSERVDHLEIKVARTYAVVFIKKQNEEEEV